MIAAVLVVLAVWTVWLFAVARPLPQKLVHWFDGPEGYDDE